MTIPLVRGKCAINRRQNGGRLNKLADEKAVVQDMTGTGMASMGAVRTRVCMICLQGSMMGVWSLFD